MVKVFSLGVCVGGLLDGKREYVSCVLIIEPYEGAEIDEDAQFSVGEFFNGTVVVQDDGCIPQSGRNQLVVH